jgi:hypothetical protein
MPASKGRGSLVTNNYPISTLRRLHEESHSCRVFFQDLNGFKSGYDKKMSASTAQIQEPAVTLIDPFALSKMARPINLADARAATVNAKKGPNCCTAGMLVMNSP